jgi:peptidoglycan/xylan/chitin deacetylase (PgdA/CDA1 family)
MRAILTYHSVDETGSVISIAERSFRRHAAWLAERHVRVVALDEITSVPPDEDAVAITFDDGLASFGRIAAPLLLEHRLPVTLFVVADAVGSSNVWRGRQDAGIPVQPLLDWEQLGALHEAGVHLGAHTCTHPRLTTLEGDALEREIVGSKQRLAREIGVDVHTFAYPYGAVSPAARDLVARTFHFGCTTRLAALASEEDPAMLPRLDSYYLRSPEALDAWGSRRFRMRLGLLAGARSVRGSLARSLVR